MYIVLVLLSLVYAVVPSLDNLDLAIQCVLGFRINKLYGHGCWCGTVGAGAPIDAVDACCFKLKQCYNRAESSGICKGVDYIKFPYFLPYKFDCVNKQAICRPENPGCAAAFCKCDSEGIQCLKNTGIKPNFGKKKYCRR
ncbi:unnamed protein product [Cylicocyclus nassatus]|uniref:Phospholipase A2 n=1 Tax=Cylicocyclus nassatus TaxID=53992 RepID=A0AA36MCU6_CYLNA|nr:unnamed protein product [Cylicocyclus nassatus]